MKISLPEFRKQRDKMEKSDLRGCQDTKEIIMYPSAFYRNWAWN